MKELLADQQELSQARTTGCPVQIKGKYKFKSGMYQREKCVCVGGGDDLWYV